MTSTLLDLGESIAKYPALQGTLGKKWIQAEGATDPVESRFTLARWLRIPECAEALKHVDALLVRLAYHPGIAERRRKLRTNPESFLETVTELRVADWLLDNGYEIVLRDKAGPDLDILLDGEAVPLEITTPRRLTWKQDTFDRLWMLAESENVSFEIESESDPDPDKVDPQAASTLCLKAARDLVGDMFGSGRRDQVSVAIPEIAVVVTVTTPRPERVTLLTSIAAARRHGAYWYAQEAAKRKSSQFLPNQPNALLVCLDQMADQDLIAFHTTLPRNAASVPFDWTGISDELTILMMCTFAGNRSAPAAGLWIPNPRLSIPITSPTVALLQTLFPNKF